MKVLWLLFLLCVPAVVPSVGQVLDCPAGFVCITPAAARKALEDSDAVKALRAEIAVKDTAIEDFRKELNAMRVEFARVSGEATALKTNAVRDAAIIELLLKYTKKKCLPFSVCF